MAEIVLARKKFEHHFVKGAVVGADKKLETKVQGGGGGGGTYRGTGYTAPVSITSTTTTHDLIHLQDDGGKEHAIRLKNWDLSVRETHQLTAVWLVKKGRKSGPYVAIHNHSLDETDYDEKTVAKLHRSLWILLGAFALIILLPFETGTTIGLMLAAWIAWWAHGAILGKKLIASGRLLQLAGV